MIEFVITLLTSPIAVVGYIVIVGLLIKKLYDKKKKVSS